METKKLGFVIMALSIGFGFAMFSYIGQLNSQGQQLKCNPTQECRQVNSMVGLSHIAVGFLSFIFSLGFYLLFFNKSEKEILEKYSIKYDVVGDTLVKNSPIEKNNQNYNSNNRGEKPLAMEHVDKFSLLLRPLDDNERKVLMSIKEQEGITQSTLRFRANLSKSKISQILADFEKKSLIERKAKGKTYQVFLTDSYDN